MGSGDHEKIRGVLSLIRELAGKAMRADSVADLFARSFPVVYQDVPFDLGAAVMLESNLDLHIITRTGFETLINDKFIEQVRLQLQTLIHPSFTSGDVVVQSEANTLPSRVVEGDSLGNAQHAVVTVGPRTAGLLLFFRIEPFTDAEGDMIEIFAATISMLLAHVEAQERILNLADTDDLTGIWNKRYFRRHLPHEMDRARIYGVPLSLLMFDVDDFKDINDNYGHTAGDVVLSELCGAVRETLRPPDMFARFGGDEFAVVLPHTDLAGACAVADRILDKVGRLAIPTDGEGVIRCSVSVGIAEFQGNDDATALVRRADDRLYISKRQGKNRYTAAS